MRRKLPIALILLVGLILSLDVFGWLPGHEAVSSEADLLTACHDQLQATTITPHLELPISTGSNVLWCGTFQLAWNEMCTLLGEDIHFAVDPPMVTPLNKKTFVRDHIDDASHVSLAGFVRNGILQKIPQALKEKFGGQAAPHYLPDPGLSPRPQDIVAYSYLFKHLEFAKHFERLDEALPFGEKKVSAFGLAEYKPAHEAIFPQVSILEYNGPDDFIIELKSKAEEDQLILAKIRPSGTLGETVEDVLARIGSATPTPMVSGDVLAVPRFNFDLTRIYTELTNRLLVVKNPKVAKDLLLLSAIQNIRFQVDEKGVRLRSESHTSFGCAARVEPQTQHYLILDKPFLVMMKRVDADAPYFALWVDNAELLVPLEE